MKFIFPQNYNFNNKLFGSIDYTTAILNIIWIIFIISISNLLFSNLTIKIFICIIFCFPLVLLSFVGLNGENIVYVLSYIIKFLIRQKLFFYSKKY